MMMGLTRLSAGEIAHAIASKQTSARDVMAAFLDRIARLNPRINALIQVDPDAALSHAEAADKAQETGAPLGPLHGVPVAIKDGFDAVGFATTFGSAALRNNRPDIDHVHVARLKAAGALVIAKSNMPEFALSNDTNNGLWGRTRNPYALDRTAGSSSGGAGAALAMDLVALADGSDVGGSIRAPASWCNIAGLRPSAGMIPMLPSPVPHDRMHVAGPMARRVDDLRLALFTMMGPHPHSPHHPPVGKDLFERPLKGDLTGIRIGASLGAKSFDVWPSVTSALAPALDVLSNAGAHVAEDDPDIAFLVKSHGVLRDFSGAEYAGWAADEHGLELGFEILDIVATARRRTGAEMERAHLQRAKAWHRLCQFFERHDLLCWPTSCTPAFLPGSKEEEVLDWGPIEISPSLNLPSASVPAGFVDGLPVGLQFIGPPGSDRLVLEAAEAIERGLKAWERHPPKEGLIPVSG